MITNKLKTIFALSIPVFIVHGIEEYIVGFYDTDAIARFVFQPFEAMTVLQATFLSFQIMLWVLLIVSSLLITFKKAPLYLMIVPGIFYILELHHIWKAVASMSYYPGVLTGIAFPFIALFFWKELLRNFQRA